MNMSEIYDFFDYIIFSPTFYSFICKSISNNHETLETVWYLCLINVLFIIILPNKYRYFLKLFA